MMMVKMMATMRKRMTMMMRKRNLKLTMKRSWRAAEKLAKAALIV